MSRRDSVYFSTGAVCTAVSIYQLVALELAHFYAMFSLGASLLLSALLRSYFRKHVFAGWSFRRIASFFVLLLAVSVLIDRVGMQVGYWEYPHYNGSDQVRKYIFEWTVALFYHFVGLVLGAEAMVRFGMDRRIGFVLSLVVFVTLIGLGTESLNLRVYSWRVTRMPFSNARIGEYFLVFQTLGYWLMALIPYALYEVTGRLDPKIVSLRSR